MTATITDISDARTRRATGQPISDRPRPVLVPISTPAKSDPAAAQIIGRHARMRDGMIGMVTGTFEVRGALFARVYVGIGISIRGVPVSELTFVEGPGPKVTA